MREVVWLERMTYVHPLTWIRQVTYPWSSVPVEPDYVYMQKGRLSTFWTWFMVVMERRGLSNEPCFPEPALYTPSMQDDGLQTGSVFGEQLRPWATEAVKCLWSSELTPCVIGVHAEMLCLFRTLIVWKVYCRWRRMEYGMRYVTSTKIACYCGR